MLVKDEEEQRAYSRLINDNSRILGKQYIRLKKINKEVRQGVGVERLEQLKLATELIARVLENHSYPSEKVVQASISSIYVDEQDIGVGIKRVVKELKNYIKEVGIEQKQFKVALWCK